MLARGRTRRSAPTRIQPRLLDPETVREAVEHRETRGLKDLLGAQQLVPAIGGHRLVGLDLTEPGVLVSQIAEAGDQHPLQGGLALLIRRRLCRRQFLGPGLELLPKARIGLKVRGTKPFPPLAKPIAGLGNEGH